MSLIILFSSLEVFDGTQTKACPLYLMQALLNGYINYLREQVLSRHTITLRLKYLAVTVFYLI